MRFYVNLEYTPKERNGSRNSEPKINGLEAMKLQLSND